MTYEIVPNNFPSWAHIPLVLASDVEDAFLKLIFYKKLSCGVLAIPGRDGQQLFSDPLTEN